MAVGRREGIRRTRTYQTVYIPGHGQISALNRHQWPCTDALPCQRLCHSMAWDPQRCIVSPIRARKSTSALVHATKESVPLTRGLAHSRNNGADSRRLDHRKTIGNVRVARYLAGQNRTTEAAMRESTIRNQDGSLPYSQLETPEPAFEEGNSNELALFQEQSKEANNGGLPVATWRPLTRHSSFHSKNRKTNATTYS